MAAQRAGAIACTSADALAMNICALIDQRSTQPLVPSLPVRPAPSHSLDVRTTVEVTGTGAAECKPLSERLCARLHSLVGRAHLVHHCTEAAVPYRGSLLVAPAGMCTCADGLDWDCAGIGRFHAVGELLRSIESAAFRLSRRVARHKSDRAYEWEWSGTWVRDPRRAMADKSRRC